MRNGTIVRAARTQTKADDRVGLKWKKKTYIYITREKKMKFYYYRYNYYYCYYFRPPKQPHRVSASKRAHTAETYYRASGNNTVLYHSLGVRMKLRFFELGYKKKKNKKQRDHSDFNCRVLKFFLAVQTRAHIIIVSVTYYSFGFFNTPRFVFL